MYTSRSRAWSCIRTRSPSRAPPEKGDEGSTASTPTRLPALRRAPTSALVEVDLPTPGEPVMPTVWACPAYGARPAITSRSRGEASSTSEISLATERGSPSRALSTSSGTSPDERRPATSGGDADDQRVTLAAAPAERGGADTAAAALELEGEVQHDPGARHADRVAERDRAAVDVDLVRVEAELAGGLDSDRGERLVELHQVEVGGGDALLLEGLGGGPRGLHLERGVGPGDHAVRADLGQPGQAELLGLGLAHHDHGAGAVGDLRGRGGGDRAVLGERRAQSRQRLGRGVAAHALVLAHHDRVALALRDRDRHDLVVEETVLPGFGGLLVRAGRESILLLAGQLALL